MQVSNIKTENYQLAVVIINYKTPKLVIDCLDSLIPELSEIDAKVIVVDNKSDDNSNMIIKNWIEKYKSSMNVELVSSSVNTGFSGGNNLGIGSVNADNYLLLNSDTLVREGSVRLLLNNALADETAGLVSPRLEWPDGTAQESCFRFHTPISELISSARTGVITKTFQRFNVPQTVTEKNDYYDWTSFACVLVKSDVFRSIGQMDDGYFMYYEDVDFSFRAMQCGWKVLNVPNARVVHLRGGSSPVKSQAKLRKRLPNYYYESRTRYFYHLYGRTGLLMANILWTIGWGISSFRSILSTSFQPNVSAKQWQDIWTNFSKPLKPYTHPDNYDQT